MSGCSKIRKSPHAKDTFCLDKMEFPPVSTKNRLQVNSSGRFCGDLGLSRFAVPLLPEPQKGFLVVKYGTYSKTEETAGGVTGAEQESEIRQRLFAFKSLKLETGLDTTRKKW